MEALGDQEYAGNLLYLLKAALDFIKLNNKKMWRKGTLYREEYFDYPERAIKEALVNALVHRDYTIIGGEIHVDIYDDRIEIVSPGGMYDGSFIQELDIFSIPSIRRNPVIADLFGRINLMERRGSGLKKIVEAYEAKHNYNVKFMPQFKSTESAFFTILKNLNYGELDVGKSDGKSDSKSDGKNGTKKITQKQKIKNRRQEILNILKENPTITAKELSNILITSIRTVERDLTRLIEAGKIKYEGSKKDGRWVVDGNLDVTQNVGQKLSPLQRRRIIIEMIHKAPNITTEYLANVFNLTARTSERDLKILIKLEKIRYEGSAKKGRWVVIKNKE